MYFFVDTVVYVSSAFSLSAGCMVPTFPSASGCALGCFSDPFFSPGAARGNAASQSLPVAAVSRGRLGGYIRVLI